MPNVLLRRTNDIDIVMRLHSQTEGEGIELTYHQSTGTSEVKVYGADEGQGITDPMEAAQWRGTQASLDGLASTLLAVYTAFMKNRIGSGLSLEYLHSILDEAYLTGRDAIINNT